MTMKTFYRFIIYQADNQQLLPPLLRMMIDMVGSYTFPYIGPQPRPLINPFPSVAFTVRAR